MTDVSLPGPVPQILASKYPNQAAWPDKEKLVHYYVYTSSKYAIFVKHYNSYKLKDFVCKCTGLRESTKHLFLRVTVKKHILLEY